MPDAREPVYRQLARVLEHRIRAQQAGYGHGSVLPTTRELSRELGHGREAITDALALLEHLGLLTRRQGYGAQVREPREREVVHVPAGATVEARMPSLAEVDLWELEPGVPMLVVDGRAYPADRYELWMGDDGEPPPAPTAGI